jgi:type III secretory pathway component EscV
MTDESHRIVYRSDNIEISTNIPGFRWPTRDEKIDALLKMGMIDEAEADRLRAALQEQSA